MIRYDKIRYDKIWYDEITGNKTRLEIGQKKTE